MQRSTYSPYPSDPSDSPDRFGPRLGALAAVAAAGCLLAPPTLAAQETLPCNFTAPADEVAERLSPGDSASLATDHGRLKVCYSRPSARGREIMGGLVPYGTPWRLGANEATVIHVTFPAEIGGVQVEPGTYSLFAVPGEEEWEIVVNSDTGHWGNQITEEVRSEDVGSATLSPKRTDQHVEQFTIDLREAESGVEMLLEWERTRVVVPIRPRG